MTIIRWGLMLAILGTSCLFSTLGAEPASQDSIVRALAAMRKVDPGKLTEDEQKVKGQELDRAWKTLVDGGSNSVTALKAEIKRIDAAKEKDDFFKLGAGTLMWQIGKIDEVQTIATLWISVSSFTDNYNYVFFPAFEAARTQDPRVLPMIIAILRDQEGEAFLTHHSMPVAWPLSHLFVWGAYGPKGTEPLLKVVSESKDDITISSAISLLTMTSDMRALEKCRALAVQGHGEARVAAIKALGRFGHPQDFEFLAAGLKGKDPMEIRNFAYALYEYEDLRAVPYLIPLLYTDNQELAMELIGCLAHLPTPEGIKALQEYAQKAENNQWGEIGKKALASLLDPLSMDYEKYAAKTPAEKTELTMALRGMMVEKFRMKPDDRKLSHDELLKAAAEWKENKRISGGSYEWVEDRHVLAVATADDIPLLLEVAAACYGRLSDECLYEVGTLQRIIHRLGRSRYRHEAGVCEKVVPPAKAGASRQ